MKGEHLRHYLKKAGGTEGGGSLCTLLAMKAWGLEFHLQNHLKERKRKGSGWDER